MKNILLPSLVLFGSLSIMLTGCSQKPKRVDLGELKTLNDSASYIIGYSQGRQMAEAFESQKVDLNKEVIARAFYQTIMGDTTGSFTQTQMQEVMGRFQADMQKGQQEAAKKVAKPNREKADKFLAENKTKEGVVTTESGLQYKIVKAGKSNKKPTMGDRVLIKYRLKTLDGKVIESTFESTDAVAPMGVSNFIPGFSEGLINMTEGSTYMFWIKPDLAYGDNDSPEIPAGSLLCFDVELLEVIK
ncbi:MAG: FKBP-type peptidyl-prolyl cis-trans isomerase [Bacteroidales bacterium]|jgi:FKBP-type peptidyl-prolyl cis-trans isomerase|nr:FKBP-type peptidyl-prolyl cis-trans isomerase [Bacteroidales bacterium]